ncbi:MAG: hypothetical protein GAK43_00786 [Stenotrophomonas maltophilia]|nr:MAG: hypothetical protein GAK43_00786 [Stenotrophomonas maltophilia]
MLKIYLAGPDVFRPDAADHGARLKALCQEYGFQGLFPLDHELPAHLTDPQHQAIWIYRANLKLIDEADCVLANLASFRGSEPDSGTCFEIGYAAAQGKPLYGYMPDASSYAERMQRKYPEWLGPAPDRDRDGNSLEAFGLPLNLMLAVPTQIVAGGPREALELLRQDLQPAQAEAETQA